MNRFKEFIATYMTSLLSILIILNLIIVLFGLMGIGWRDIIQVPTYFWDVLQDPAHYLSHDIHDTTTSTDHTIRKTSGVITDSNIKLVCSDETFSAAVSKVRPAVVNISCERITSASNASTVAFDDPAQDLSILGGIGSGIIVDSRGYILSCYHIIAQAQNIFVIPFGYEIKRYSARLVAKNEEINLALLRINAQDLPAVSLGDSDLLEIADVMLAIGSPFGLEQSVTHGIISDNRRDVIIGGNIFQSMLQTDVPINRGSSGGPLININGEVVGINMAIYSPTGVYIGVSFALPINQAKLFLSKNIR
ncbi:Magnetosome protein MamE N-ter [Candidatus Magnetomoraceae bacterium gMMP-15]